MVQVECFKFELVDATTKIPFKEHTKEGRTYVEVEPDVEYFISMQKIAKTETDVVISWSIDAQQIDGVSIRKRKSIDHEPDYTGILNFSGDIVTETSLVFKKPTICHTSSESTSNFLMGNVEIKIHELRYLDGFRTPGVSVSTFKAVSVNLPETETGTRKKKCLRSDKGSAVITRKMSSSKHRRWERGAHLDTIKLNYCAALGLMEVGVLKKPSFWEHHRMKNPAEPGSNPFAVQGYITGNVVDLSTFDSDDED